MACSLYELDLITALRNASVAEKVDYFEAMFEKNKKFFLTESKAVYELLLKHGQTDFGIEMTEHFFNIIDSTTQQPIHPMGQLDTYAETLGSILGEQWSDLINFRVAVFNQKDSLHTRFCLHIERALHHLFPKYDEIMIQRVVNIKKLMDVQAYYMPCVVFLGIAHGLHIAHFMHHSIQNNVFLYEPSIPKFILSCYFLDYEQLKQNTHVFMLAIGQNQLNASIRMFMSQQSFAQRVWLRVCSDPLNITAQKTHDVLNALKASQMRSDHVFFPIDLYLIRRKNAVEQLQRNLPLLTTQNTLSSDSQVVIVGSGPSLDENIAWLKQNKEKLIIFAVLSSVRVLTAHAIVPDFVFTIDTTSADTMNEATFNIPKQSIMVGMHGICSRYTHLTEQTYLCGILQESAFIRYAKHINFHGPSTINFVMSVALFFHVKSIYLVGCDCGYTKVENLYAHGTSHHALFGEDVAKIAVTKGEFQIAKNSNPSEMISSTTELMNVLSGLVSTIQDFNQGSMIYNLATNGAYIRGTKAKLSKNVKLGHYKKRQNDLQSIHNAFVPAEKDKNWFLYSNGAKAQFTNFKKAILDELKQMPQSWDEITYKLESVACRKYLQLKEDMTDGRLGPYLFLFEYPLRIIFNYLIRLDIFTEAQEVYKVAINLFEQQMNEIEWPQELDEF